jgi:hypothetical protein
MATAKSTPIWRISVIGGKKAEYLGIITAPDAQAAIDKACEEFHVTNPERRKRVVAQPIAKGAERS